MANKADTIYSQTINDPSGTDGHKVGRFAHYVYLVDDVKDFRYGQKGIIVRGTLLTHTGGIIIRLHKVKWHAKKANGKAS